MQEQGKKLPYGQQVRSPEELARIRRNLHAGVAASRGTKAEFDAWFDQEFADKKPGEGSS